MTQESAVKASRDTKASNASPSTAEQRTQGSTLKDSLRGKTYDEQEALLAPEGPSKPLPKGTPLGSGVVLSDDTKYATTGYTPWFASQLKAKIESWGLTFDPKSVRVADKGGTDVLALDWDTAWGAAPTAPIGLDFAPVDARAAMTAVHALSGWGKTPSDDQPRIDALIGGQTNDVSKAGRENLRPKFGGLGSLDADAQAATLTGLLGAKDSAPAVVAEQVETAPATVTVSGPKEQKDYAFRGVKADAHLWEAAYGDGSKLTIAAPKAPDPKFHQHSVTEAAEAARYLPPKNRAAINTIVLNPIENPDDAHWAVAYSTPDFHSYMTAGKAGVVTIYPNEKKAQPGENYMRGTMIHETGHTWSYQQWGDDTTKGKWAEWKTAMGKDKNTVSQYASASIAEDVAETVQAYGSTKGKPKYDEYKALVPNRFAMLESELG